MRKVTGPTTSTWMTKPPPRRRRRRLTPCFSRSRYSYYHPAGWLDGFPRDRQNDPNCKTFSISSAAARFLSHKRRTPKPSTSRIYRASSVLLSARPPPRNVSSPESRSNVAATQIDQFLWRSFITLYFLLILVACNTGYLSFGNYTFNQCSKSVNVHSFGWSPSIESPLNNVESNVHRWICIRRSINSP